MHFLKTLLFIFCFICFNKLSSQNGAMPPFTLQIEAINNTNVPGLHSFAFAKSTDKWLFIGGRTNGLHGINSNDGFPPEHKNNAVIVVDTTTWTYYSADLNQLPKTIADPMRSTNMQYIQDGNYLYMIGGFGYDSTFNMYVTFPILTAIHVNDMINAVINAQPITSTIRQVVDTNLAVCGGELGKLGNDFYLLFGHNFGGRYSDPPTPLFTQQYTDRIKKFNLSDNGTTIALSNYSYQIDTTNFHRRDLNVGPIVEPNGNLSLEAYGGVFRKDSTLPFREPIKITSTGTTVNTAYKQVMSQYTSGLIPIYDSVTQTMFTTFLGGISLYDYNHFTNTAIRDSLVPFIDDITTLTEHGNGTMEETVLPTILNGRLGSNAKFIPNLNLSHYANEVINFRNLPNTKTLLGYMFGGIRAQSANLGTTIANDTVYRIYITANLSVGIADKNNIIQNAILFPNPANQSTTLLFNLMETQQIQIFLTDIIGKKIMDVSNELFQKGNQQITIDTSKLSSGIYFCKIVGGKSEETIKLAINK